MRIIRQQVFHQGTFESILKRLSKLSGCLRYGGRYWECVYRDRGVAIFRPMGADIDWLRERMEDYEQYFYGQLAAGYCNKDGVLRVRTKDVCRTGGAFRQSSGF